jgi:hypothetical protein
MPSKKVGALNVSLDLNSGKFVSGLKGAKAEAAGFAKSLSSMSAAGAAVGVALTGAAVALGASIKSALDRADEMSKAAQKFGVPIDQLSKLKYAADLSDVSMESLGVGLKKLSVGMVDLAEGGGKGAAGALKSLGVSATDAQGRLRPTADVLVDIAGKFAGMADGAQKTALAVAIFGKSGADLIPLLNSGKDGLAALNAEAERLGLVLDQKTGTAAEAFNDNLTRLHAAQEGVSTQLATRLAPALVGITNAMVGATTNTALMDSVGKGLATTLKVLVSTGVIVGAVFKTVFEAVGATVKGVFQIINFQWADALKTAQTQIGDLKATVTGSAAALKGIWSSTGDAAASAAPKVVALGAALGGTGAGAAKHAAAMKAAEDATKKFDDELKRVLDRLKTPSERTAQEQQETADFLEKAYKAGKLTYAQYYEQLHRLYPAIVSVTDAVKPFSDEVNDSADALDNAADRMRDTRTEAEKLADAFTSAGDSFFAMVRGLKSGDLSSAVRGFESLTSQFKSAFGKGGTFTDQVSAVAGVADAAGQMIGGKTGRALSNAAIGAQLGSMILPGIGTAIGAIVGGISTFLGGKPSNKGAGLGLTATGLGALSGNKRDSDTENAVKEAGSAILTGEQALRDAGLKLKDTISGVVIGTRDLSQIYTSSGKTLTAAVGDVQAAAETALQEVLRTAEYTSDAQKKVADSALAAGKSFDQVLQILADFQAAQDLGQAFTDAIQAITDPQGFQVTQLKRAQKARDDQLQAALDAGYLTADQFAALTEQLSKLKGLELDQVMGKLASAADTAASAVEAAKGKLQAAYDAEASSLQDLASDMRGFSADLRDYAKSLTDPSQQSFAQLSARFSSVASLAAQGDRGALGQFREVAEAFRGAGVAAATSGVEARRIEARIRTAAEDAADAADQQATIAEAQLAELTRTVDALLGVDRSVLSVRDAISGLSAAMSALAASKGGAGGLAADAPIDVATYGADNPDVVAAFAAGTFGADRFNNVNDWLAYHYQVEGKDEIAQGIRKFAGGGMVRVGGMGGIDSQLVALHATPGELIDIRPPGQDPLASAQFANRLLFRQGKLLAKMERYMGFIERWETVGMPPERDAA